VPHTFRCVSHAVVLTVLFFASTAYSQDLVRQSRPAVSSQRDLVAALQAAGREGFDEDIETALIATWGEPVTSWALQVALDPRQRWVIRALAFKVVGYSRQRDAIVTLQSVAQPGSDAAGLWAFALSALAKFPYPELAPF
jgi:hypothetical protein